MKNKLPHHPIAKDFVLNRDHLNEESFKQMIRKMGLKVTTQRTAILSVLNKGRVHMTAQEVFEAISGDYPEIGFATVYRFLKKMSEHSFVSEVRMGGLPARYELTTNRHHDHLTCTKCGRICEFENDSIEKLQEKVAKEFGFILTNHVLELYGVCPSCQKK